LKQVKVILMIQSFMDITQLNIRETTLITFLERILQMEFNLEEYNCPHCGWDEAEFYGTFYRLDDNGEQVFDLSGFDLEETKLPLPEEYYPKIFDSVGNHRDGFAWKETWLCPRCNKEFTFKNEN